MSVVLTWAGLAFPHQEGSWLVAGSQKQSLGLFPTNLFEKPPADQIALFSVLSQHPLDLMKTLYDISEAVAHFSTSRVLAWTT